MSKIIVKVQDTNKIFQSAHVAIFNNGKVLILRRSSTDEWMPGHYGLPGGKLEPEEDLMQAICRECKEETSLSIFPKEIIFLPKVSNNNEHAFFCTSNFAGEVKLDFEHDDFQWAEPKELSKYKVVHDLPQIISEALEKINSET